MNFINKLFCIVLSGFTIYSNAVLIVSVSENDFEKIIYRRYDPRPERKHLLNVIEEKLTDMPGFNYFVYDDGFYYTFYSPKAKKFSESSIRLIESQHIKIERKLRFE